MYICHEVIAIFYHHEAPVPSLILLQGTDKKRIVNIFKIGLRIYFPPGI